jgi:PAS domain S-box-containing protein
MLPYVFVKNRTLSEYGASQDNKLVGYLPNSFLMQFERPVRILIVDDDPLDRALYRHCLPNSRSWQFEFEEADTVSSGLERARIFQPDCTLLDFNLPDMDGLEAIDQIRGEFGKLPTAVVMLTAFGDEELAVRAMKAGAMDYLPKENLTATLARTVASAIERHQMQERIEAQRTALENTGRYLQNLLEAIPQMVWTANAEGRLQYANQRWTEYTGLAVAEAERLGWNQCLHPDDRYRTLEAWESAIASGSVFEIEHRLRRASDGSYRWHLVRAVPMRSAGELTNWLGTCTEIEDQKQADRAIQQQEKLEGIGALAGGVAHDFNNLLMSIVGGASCAMERLPDSHPAQDLLHDVVEAGEHAAELTRKMLAYAGKGNYCLEAVDIGRLARETCDALRSSLPPIIHLECSSGCSVPLVQTDPNQMRQVLVDLVKNAVESIGEGSPGRVSVRTSAVEFDEKSIARMEFALGSAHSGNYVALEVRDTGCGMDEQTQKRIFDPFFTTKFMGRGLGLAAVGGFIRSQKGGVQVESGPGKGTRFCLMLPARAEHARGARHG